MIYIENNSHNPYFNLALEEYIFNKAEPDKEYLLLWQNEPTIVVGKHQNTIEEINIEYINKNNINVVRRLSGGGAVYHDLGNLNFTFIVGRKNNDLFNFEKFTTPVIKALAKIGVKAEFNSRNDLVIEGRKFSGNSQYSKKGKILHHGTLLYDSDIHELTKSLKVSSDKIESKGIKSIKSRVTNICEHLSDIICIDEFKRLLLEYLTEDKLEMTELSTGDLLNIKKLANKYSDWNWNYGQSPKFNLKRSKRYDGGKLEIYLNVEKGLIDKCKIYGDFFGSGEIKEVEEKLIGIRYNSDSIKSAISNIDMKEYFSNITYENIIELLLPQ